MSEKKRRAKGSGSFVKMKDGTVQMRKDVGWTEKGTKKVLTVRGPTEAACIKLMREKESEWERWKNRRIFEQDITIVELCRKHLEYQKDDLEAKSYDRREVTVERHIGDYSIGGLQAAAVTSEDVSEHISELLSSGLSPSSMKKVVDVLGAAYRWANDNNALECDPVKPIRKRLLNRIVKSSYKMDNEADVEILSDEDVRKFEEYVEKRKTKGKRTFLPGLYGRLLLHTGLRCGELCGLHWKDISEDWVMSIRKSRTVVKSRDGDDETAYKGIIKSTKNHKARKIELLPKAIEDLKEIRQLLGEVHPEDLICVTATGKPNTATNLEHRMAVIYRDAGLDVSGGSLHLLRRTFATWLYRKTLDVKLVAAYIGDLESTVMKYYIAAREKVVSADGTVQQVVRIRGLSDL